MISIRSLCLTLLVQSVCVPSLLAKSVEVYTMQLENGIVCGQHIVTHLSKTHLTVSEQCIENGRGPKTLEDIELTDKGDMKRYDIQGESEMGGQISEHFELKQGLAQWHSSAEAGQLEHVSDAFFLPLNSTLSVNSLMISALARRNTDSLALLPSGQLHQTRLASLVLREGHQRLRVQLLMLTGIGLRPDFIWATTGTSAHMFAFVSSGYSMYKAEWKNAIAKLKEVQNQKIQALLEQRAQSLQHPVQGTLVIRNATVFDSRLAQNTPPQNIYIQNDKIVRMEDASTQPMPADWVVDAHGQTLLPALTDMHAHINPWSGAYNLVNGVTTVRDLGNVNADIAHMMQQTAQGLLLAPTIVPAGLIEGKSEFATSDGIMIDSLEQAKQAVDQYHRWGYKHIKIYSSFPKDWVKETAAHAHSLGMTVGGHVPAFMTSQEAIEAGYDEVNHINQLLLHFVANDKTDSRTLDRFYLPAEKFGDLDFKDPSILAFIDLIKKHHVTIDPTLAGFDFIKQQDGELAEPFETIVEHMPPDTQRGFRQGAMNIPDQATAERYKKSYQAMINFTGLLYQQGVPIVAGTDTFAGFGLHSELALYVKAGLTPAQAIQVATLGAAQRLGLTQEMGSIEVGKAANLILVEGNPSQNIEDLRKITLVLTRGQAIYPNEIYPLLGVRPFVNHHATLQAQTH